MSTFMLNVLILSIVNINPLPQASTFQWSSFRNGGPSLTKSENLPISWAPNKGIRWEIELRGYGQSAPVIWGNTAFLLSVEGLKKEKCVLTAIHLNSGKVRWTKAWKSSTQALSNYRVSRAAPTPVVDQKGLYAFFETGEFIAVTHEGTLLWKRSLTKDYGTFQNHHGLGSSPTQDKDRIFLNIEHRGPSYLLAINKSDGKTAWKTSRKSGMSWSSPIVIDLNGEPQVVVSSNGTITGYHTQTGKVCWTMGNLGGNSKVSPIAVDSKLFVAGEISEFGTEAQAARSNLCLDLSTRIKDRYPVRWRARSAVCHYASPVVCGDCIVYVNKQGVVHCLNKSTGKELYRKRLQFTCWATPLVAGNHVYFFGTDGNTKVLKAGPDYKLVASNHLWNPDNPPKPEEYVEATSERKHPMGQSGPFLKLLVNDKNGDKRLSKDELPKSVQQILSNVDLNKDGALDSQELKKMDEQFRQRRAGSREASRDPIVYGIAAVEGTILIRTGTRLYCVGSMRPAEEGGK